MSGTSVGYCQARAEVQGVWRQVPREVQGPS